MGVLMRVLPVLVVAVLAAGCLAVKPSAPAVSSATADAVEAYALARLPQDHDHAKEPGVHVGSIGFASDTFVPAEKGAYADREVYAEMAVRGGYAYVTYGPATGSFVQPGVDAGLIVYDVHSAAEPREIGRWHGEPLGDVEVSADGNWVFASTQRNGYPYPETLTPGTDPLAESPRGTYVLDAHDKAHLAVASFEPLPPNGPHTITYVKLPDGRELLLACTYDIVFTTYPNNVGQNKASQKVVIYEIDDSPAGGKVLKPLSIFQRLDADTGDLQFFPHDATVHIDPASKKPIMDVAYWDLGLIEVDISDPANPVELSEFKDAGPSHYTHTHLVRVFPGSIDGRLVAVLEPEIPSGTDSGQYTFVDVTDAKAPKKLGYWALPGKHVIDKPFIFSPHNFDVACGGNGEVGAPADAWSRPCADPTVVLSHFHGGLWTLDASDPAMPRATGFFFPNVTRTNVDPSFFPPTGFMTTFMVNGTIYAPEVWTGLHVLTMGTETTPTVTT
ncbi:MAG: LVIVD repeat-containing protein [Thermoplasmatota archaeon]